MAFKEGVSIARLWEETDFLGKLLKREYVQPELTKTFDNFKNLLSKMVKNGVINIVDEKVTIASDKSVNFMNSLIWPLVESYWATLTYLFTLKDKVLHIEIKKLHQ